MCESSSKLAKIHFEILKKTKNKKIFEILKKHSDCNNFIKFQLARYYALNNNIKHAIDLLKTLTLPEAKLLLGKLYLNIHPKKGIKILKSLSQKYPQANIYIGDFYFEKMKKEVCTNFDSCIAFNFQKDNEFLNERKKMYEFEKQYIHTYILPWYLKSKELAKEKIKQIKSFLDLSKESNTTLNCPKLLKEKYLNENNLTIIKCMEKLFPPNSKEYELLLKKECKLSCPNLKNIDLKIALFHFLNNKIKKAKTIFKFYAPYSPKANYYLALCYEKEGFENPENFYNFLKYLKIAYKKNYFPAKQKYYQYVLEGFIKDDTNQAKQFFLQEAKRNPCLYKIVGDYYLNIKYNPLKAIFFYKKTINCNKKIILKIINIYKEININNKYNKTIEYFYQKALNLGFKVDIDYAKFLISINKLNKAKKILNQTGNSVEKNILLYQITQDPKYLFAYNLNYPPLLAQKAIYFYNKQKYIKALIFAAKAAKCNSKTGLYILIKTLPYLKDNEEIYNIYKNNTKNLNCIKETE